MRRHSLRLRLVLAGVVSVVAALGLAVIGLTALFSSHVERHEIAELSLQLDQILAGIDRNPDGVLVVSRAPADAAFTAPLGGLYWQIEAEGRQLRSRSLWDSKLDLPPDTLSDGAAHVHYIAGPGGGELLTLERSVTLPKRLGGTALRAAVAMDAAGLDEGTAAFRKDLLPYAALLAGFLIVASIVQVTIGLRPLNRIENRVAQVRTGARLRIGSDFPDEIKPLASEVDELLQERERDIQQARHRAGDLAHGFKTPLQALMGEAGRLRTLGQKDCATNIEDITQTMRRHVDRELTRVRIAMPERAARSHPAKVAARVVAVVRQASGRSDLVWSEDIPPDLVVCASEEDLLDLLGAILENAARFASSSVSITAARQDVQAVIVIRDDGPGIPPHKIETFMRRGIRADETGAGTGLGLAIARELAEALGGCLALAPGNPGLVVRITLPLAAN